MNFNSKLYFLEKVHGGNPDKFKKKNLINRKGLKRRKRNRKKCNRTTKKKKRKGEKKKEFKRGPLGELEVTVLKKEEGLPQNRS